jgi:hypothetical protein
MKTALRKSKPALIFALGFWLVGMSFFFSACQNTPISPPTPFGSMSNHGGSGSAPGSASSNYAVGAVNYEISSVSGAAVTTYELSAGIAVQQTPVTNAAVTFTDPNGTTQYPLAYAGSSVTVNGITCGFYQAFPASFSTSGTFNFKVVTTDGISSASVTAFNSTSSFPSPYTSLSWTGTTQQNIISVISVATPSTSYSQNGTTSPMSIPASIYSSGVTYDYEFIQDNENNTLSAGTGSFGYFQITDGTFVAP